MTSFIYVAALALTNYAWSGKLPEDVQVNMSQVTISQQVASNSIAFTNNTVQFSFLGIPERSASQVNPEPDLYMNADDTSTLHIHNITLGLPDRNGNFYQISNCRPRPHYELSTIGAEYWLLQDGNSAIDVALFCQVGVNYGASQELVVFINLTHQYITTDIYDKAGNKITIILATILSYSGSINAANCPGDVDGDGIVNFIDLVKLSQNYKNPNPFRYTDYTVGDLNIDGQVDLADLQLLSQHYSTRCFSW